MAYTPDIQDDSGNIVVPNTISTQNLIATGDVELGNVANVHIQDGSNGQVLTTNGAGNLSWTSVLKDEIYNGTSNVRIATPNGNVVVATNGSANRAIFSDAGLAVGGNVTANDFSSANSVSVTGRLTAANANIINNANVGVVITNSIVGSSDDVSITAAAGNFDINLVPTGTGAVNASGARVINVSSPTTGSDAATKGYVDGVSQGLSIKTAVELATSGGLAYAYTYNNGTAGVGATLTATGFAQLVIDGIIASVGNRILVKDESGAAGAYNGIYVVTRQGDGAAVTWQMTRATDFDVNTEMYSGYTYVMGGANNAYTSWVCNNNATSSPITIGTTPLTFVQFSDAAQYSAGSGIALNGIVFSANTDNLTTTIIGGNIAVKPSAQLTTPNIGSATGVSLTTTNDIVVGGNANISGTATAANVFSNVVTANAVTVSGNLTATSVAASLVYSSGNVVANGNVQGSNVVATGNISGQNLALTGAANVTGNVTAGNINTAGSATVGGTVTAGNLSSTGFLNVAGNASVGNLVAPTAAITGNLTSGNAALGNLASANYFQGNVITAAQPNITSLGNLTALNVAGVSQLGSNSNVIITGGTTGQVLTTNGAGNLRWSSVTSTPAGTDTQVQFNANGAFSASAGLTYNPATQVLNAAALTTTSANLGSASNLKITGGTNGYVLKTDGAANLTWVDPATIPASTANMANYAANVTVAAQSNITTLGTLTGVTVSGTAALNTVTANAITSNIVTANSFVGNITTANQPGITGVGTLGSLAVAGNETVGGNLTVTGNVSAQQLTSTVANGTAPLTVASSTLVPNLYASRATVSDQTNVTATTSGTAYPVFATGNTTNSYTLVSNANISVNLATGVITAAGFSGNITGNAVSAGTVTTAAQPNITSVGTLTGLTVNGDTNLGPSSNVHITGGSVGQVLSTDGNGNLSWNTVSAAPGGANRQLQFNDNGLFQGVAALTFNKVSNTLSVNSIVTTTSANLGDAANITILGGLQDQVLKTDGYGVISWANANSVVAASGSNRQLQYNDGNLVAGASGITYNKLTDTTTISNIAVTAGANLGAVGNIKITGGAFGQYLQTDGNGVLNWSTGSGGGGNGTPGGVNTSVQFNDNGNFAGDAGFSYNKTIDTLTVGAIISANGANLGANSNVIISGGTSGQYLKTDGFGNLSWATATGTAGNPAGANGELQFNGGANNFAASGLLNFNTGNGALRIGNSVTGTTTVIANGAITAANTITGRQVVITGPANTAPMIVTSNALVANLNADQLRGSIPLSIATANSIVIRDANASFSANIINVNTLTTTNTNLVANLNAARLGGYPSNVTAQNDTIPVRDANGNMYVNQLIGNVQGTIVGNAQPDGVFGTRYDIANVQMAGSDYFRILAGGNTGGTGLGWVEIATADDGSEPIYVRQYAVGAPGTSPFNSVVNQATILDATGNTVFPKTVQAQSVVASGNITANTITSNNITVSGAGVIQVATVDAANLKASNSLSVVNGAFFANATQANTSGNLLASGYVTAGNIYANSGLIRGNLLQGTLTTNAQPNITQLGTLTSLTVNGAITSNTVTANGQIQAINFVSTTTNAAPLTVSSNVQVANLNASLLAGKASDFRAAADTIVLRDANGNINAFGGYFGDTVIFGVTTPNKAPFAVGSPVKVNSLNSDFLDGFSADQANSSNTVVVRDVGGNITGRDIFGQRFVSLTTTGTAPLVVSSTTIVPNLNVQYVGGYAVPTNASLGNTIVVRNSTGQIQASDLVLTGQVISNVTGVAPIITSSNVQVANLNTEFHGGYRANIQNIPSTVVVRDANGVMVANTLNLSNSITAINGNITNLNVIANANVGGAIVANGNISMNGNYLYAGNANAVFNTVTANSLSVANINVSGIGNGTSGVNIPVANGNILFTVGGAGNLYSMSSTQFLSNSNITTTGTITASTGRFTSNGTGKNIAVGDDVWLGDINATNSLSLRGQQDENQAWMTFGSANTTRTLGRGPSQYDPIESRSEFRVNKNGIDTGETNWQRVVELRSSKSSAIANDGGQVYLGTPRTTGFYFGTLTVSNEGGDYGAIMFGKQTDCSLSRNGFGDLEWNGGWRFRSVGVDATTNTFNVSLSNSAFYGNVNVASQMRSFSANITQDVRVGRNLEVVGGITTNGGIEVGYKNLPIVTVPSGGNITLTGSDSAKMVHQTGLASTVNIPTNAGVPFVLGTVIVVFNSSAAPVDVKPLSGVTTVQTGYGPIAGVRIAQWGQVTLTKFDVDRWSISGTGFIAL